MKIFTIKEFKRIYPTFQVHPENKLSGLRFSSDDRKHSFEISLLRKGMIHPIIIVDNLIYDGMARCETIYKLHDEGKLSDEFEIKIVDWTDRTDLEESTFDLHLHYKDLSKSQRAAIAVRYWMPRLQDEAEKRMKLGKAYSQFESSQEADSIKDNALRKGNASDIAGYIVGCSGRLVNAAKKGIEALPESYDWIMNGQMTATDAENLAEFPEDKQDIMIQLLNKGKSFGIAKQRFTNKVKINNDIKTAMEERKSQGKLIDMSKTIATTRQAEANSTVDAIISDSTYTGALTKECTSEEAEGIPHLLTVHKQISWEVLESLALVMCKNGYCDELTVMSVKDKLYLIKPQQKELKLANIPKAS